MDVVLSATKKTYECIAAAERYFGRSFTLTGISFDLKGRAAGQLRYSRDARTYSIRYNRLLLEVNPRQVIDQTVPHEVAHLVAYQVYGHKISQHGSEWSSVMVDVFARQPDRCHSMDTSVVVARPFIYGCLCGSEIKVTKKHHGRIQKSSGYICRKCKSKIMFTREEVPELISPVAERLLVSSFGESLTPLHVNKIKDLLGSTKVKSIILHGDAAINPNIIRLASQLGITPGSIGVYPRRESIPDSLTHALFFIDQPTERQLVAIEALRNQKASVRLVRHPTKPLSR